MRRGLKMGSVAENPIKRMLLLDHRFPLASELYSDGYCVWAIGLMSQNGQISAALAF